jgi:hypothetical protein
VVKKIWLLFLLFLLNYSSLNWADVLFSVKADKKSIALGEPLTLEIKTEGAEASLSSVNLDKLKQNFNVFGISSNVQTQIHKGRSIRKETMSLILYPLHSGNLTLPVLSFMKKSSKALNVTVVESGKQTSQVIFKVAIDSVQRFVRQANTLTLDIYDDGTLQWSAPRELVAVGFHQIKLAESQFEETLAGMRYTVHRYAWSLMPLRDGKLTVEFPLLDALKLGSRLRYPVPPLKLDVAAVPSYLPMHVPIGKLQVSTESLPSEIALDRPVNWQFKIQGRGITAEGLHKLMNLPSADKSLRFYPAVIAPSANERPTSAVQTMLVTLPFVPLQSGRLTLPEINFPYYNTEHARIESVVIAETTVNVFNPLWRTVQNIVLWILLLLSVVVVAYVLWKKLRQFMQMRKSLLKIANANSTGELQQMLLQFGVMKGAGPFFTLQQWLEYMRQNYHVDEVLSALVANLEVACYGAGVHNIEPLAQSAARLLKNSRPKNSGTNGSGGFILKLRRQYF